MAADSPQSEADKSSGKSTASGPDGARLNVWQIIVAGVIIALLGGAVIYGRTFMHESTFHDARAFRVLADIAAQFRNLEVSRATLLDSLPDNVQRALPVCGASRSGAIDPEVASYRARLDLPDTDVCRNPSQEPQLEGEGEGAQAAALRMHDVWQSLSTACDKTNGVILRMDVGRDRFTSLRCREGADSTVLRESFSKAVGRFVAQDFFDEALIVTANGTVLGEFPIQAADTLSNRVRLHPTLADRLSILDARGLMKESTAPPKSKDEKSADTSPPTSAASDGGLAPAAFDKLIAGEDHRVFVLPFMNPYDLRQLMRGGDGVRAEARTEVLYIIGLRRVAVANQILSAIGPGGLWILTILISLNLVAWPLLSLAFGAPEESFSPWRAFGCLLGVLLVPVIVAVAVVSTWSGYQMQAFMRQAGWDYLRDLSGLIHASVIDSARILDSYRPMYSDLVVPGAPPPTCPALDPATKTASSATRALEKCNAKALNAPLIGFSVRQALPGCLVEQGSDPCETLRLTRAPDADAGTTDWSPVRSVTALNRDGQRFGPVFTVFNNFPISRTLLLNDREYFQSLSQDQAWVASVPKKPGPTALTLTSATPSVVISNQRETIRFVAQRLFNRGDASKALQIAVPLCKSGERSFCGVITGDLRMHSLIAPVTPPLLKFVVFDTTTGTVLFHSNDARSLAENFFREAEEDAALVAAIRAAQPDEFDGRYLGEPYHFFYAPVEDMPWGVAVLYSRKELTDLQFRTGSAALAAYSGAALMIVLIALLVWVGMRAAREGKWSLEDIAMKAWPSVPLSERYGRIARWHPGPAALVVLAVALLFAWPVWLGALAAYVVMGALIIASLRAQRPCAMPNEPRARLRRYIGFVMAIVTAVTVIPAYWLVLKFHVLQYDALVRDGLVQAATQMQRRHDLIGRDLMRWNPADIPRARDKAPPPQLPDAWTLTFDPDVGVSRAAAPIPSSVAVTQADTPIRARDITWAEQLIWRSLVDSPDQRRRLGLAHIGADGAASPRRQDISCGVLSADTEMRDACNVRMSDGSRLTVAAAMPILIRFPQQGWDWAWLPIVVTLFGIGILGAAIYGLVHLFACRLLGLTASYMDHVATRSPRVRAATDDPVEFDDRWKNGLPQCDRLVLYQLATGHLVNPRNEAAVDRLIDGRWIALSPWPRLANARIKRLVLDAQRPAEFASWQSEAARGVWKTIRLPLFILLMLLVAWLNWTSGALVRGLTAVLFATVASLGPVAQIITLARSGLAQSGK